MSATVDRVLVVIGRTRHKMVVVELQEAVKRGAKFIELRLDFLAKAVDFKRLAPYKQCPWVATLRRPADGGRFPGTEKVPGLENAGSIALGGPIATAGGLVFTAGTFEAAIYAFDTRTGDRLWKGTLPTSARSTPMTYLGRDGRQYVVISAGGHGTAFGPPIGDYLVAFALPK